MKKATIIFRFVNVPDFEFNKKRKYVPKTFWQKRVRNTCFKILSYGDTILKVEVLTL